MKRYGRKTKGITLIALIITIIILLILAGITISALTGENVLLSRGKQASEQSNMKQAEESIKLILNNYRIESATENKELIKFLEEEKVKKEIDDYESNDENIDIIKNGYFLTVDFNGNIISQIEKLGPRPQINNIKITLEDGETIPEDYSQEIGTKLIVSFDASIDNGKITGINPSIPYTTNGNEKEIEFEIKAKVEEKEYTKKVKVSVKNKYENIYEAESLIKSVEANELTDGISKVSINNEIYSLHVYNYNTSQTWTQNMTFGDENDVATADRDAKNMVVVKVNGDLTVNEGVTVAPYYTSYGGPKGFLLYVTGTIINNGIIDNSHGAKAEGQNVYLWKNNDNTYEYVPAVGASGGPGGYNKNNKGYAGIKGNNGNNRKTGGGGSGGNSAAYYSTNWPSSGSGANGTSYSGGTGGGSSGGGTPTYSYITSGSTNGGNGGHAGSGNSNNYQNAGGGAGNPGGWGASWENNGKLFGTNTGNSRHGYAYKGTDGTGGLLIIFGKNISNNGTISSNGSKGGSANEACGGSSGGGSINIFYIENINQNGSTNVEGGASQEVTGSKTFEGSGGAGGNGSISIGNISTGTYVNTFNNY